jgi:hypothetical protein
VSLERRISRLESMENTRASDEPCEACGWRDGGWDECEVVWVDVDDDVAEPLEEFCEACGRQTSKTVTIVWDDIPSRKQGGEGGPSADGCLQRN